MKRYKLNRILAMFLSILMTVSSVNLGGMYVYAEENENIEENITIDATTEEAGEIIEETSAVGEERETVIISSEEETVESENETTSEETTEETTTAEELELQSVNIPGVKIEGNKTILDLSVIYSETRFHSVYITENGFVIDEYDKKSNPYIPFSHIVFTGEVVTSSNTIYIESVPTDAVIEFKNLEVKDMKKEFLVAACDAEIVMTNKVNVESSFNCVYRIEKNCSLTFCGTGDIEWSATENGSGSTYYTQFVSGDEGSEFRINTTGNINLDSNSGNASTLEVDKIYIETTGDVHLDGGIGDYTVKGKQFVLKGNNISLSKGLSGSYYGSGAGFFTGGKATIEADGNLKMLSKAGVAFFTGAEVEISAKDMNVELLSDSGIITASTSEHGVVEGKIDINVANLTVECNDNVKYSTWGMFVCKSINIYAQNDITFVNSMALFYNTSPSTLKCGGDLKIDFSGNLSSDNFSEACNAALFQGKLTISGKKSITISSRNHKALFVNCDALLESDGDIVIERKQFDEIKETGGSIVPACISGGNGNFSCISGGSIIIDDQAGIDYNYSGLLFSGDTVLKAAKKVTLNCASKGGPIANNLEVTCSEKFSYKEPKTDLLYMITTGKFSINGASEVEIVEEGKSNGFPPLFAEFSADVNGPISIVSDKNRTAFKLNIKNATDFTFTNDGVGNNGGSCLNIDAVDITGKFLVNNNSNRISIAAGSEDAYIKAKNIEINDNSKSYPLCSGNCRFIADTVALKTQNSKVIVAGIYEFEAKEVAIEYPDEADGTKAYGYSGTETRSAVYAPISVCTIEAALVDGKEEAKTLADLNIKVYLKDGELVDSNCYSCELGKKTAQSTGYDQLTITGNASCEAGYAKVNLLGNTTVALKASEEPVATPTVELIEGDIIRYFTDLNSAYSAAARTGNGVIKLLADQNIVQVSVGAMAPELDLNGYSIYSEPTNTAYAFRVQYGDRLVIKDSSSVTDNGIFVNTDNSAGSKSVIWNSGAKLSVSDVVLKSNNGCGIYSYYGASYYTADTVINNCEVYGCDIRDGKLTFNGGKFYVPTCYSENDCTSTTHKYAVYAITSSPIIINDGEFYVSKTGSKSLYCKNGNQVSFKDDSGLKLKSGGDFILSDSKGAYDIAEDCMIAKGRSPLTGEIAMKGEYVYFSAINSYLNNATSVRGLLSKYPDNSKYTYKSSFKKHLDESGNVVLDEYGNECWYVELEGTGNYFGTLTCDFYRDTHYYEFWRKNYEGEKYYDVPCICFTSEDIELDDGWSFANEFTIDSDDSVSAQIVYDYPLLECYGYMNPKLMDNQPIDIRLDIDHQLGAAVNGVDAQRESISKTVYDRPGLKEPTCTEEGLGVSVCLFCGRDMGIYEEPSAGHNWRGRYDWTGTTAEEAHVVYRMVCRNNPEHVQVAPDNEIFIEKVNSSLENYVIWRAMYQGDYWTVSEKIISTRVEIPQNSVKLKAAYYVDINPEEIANDKAAILNLFEEYPNESEFKYDITLERELDDESNAVTDEFGNECYVVTFTGKESTKGTVVREIYVDKNCVFPDSSMETVCTVTGTDEIELPAGWTWADSEIVDSKAVATYRYPVYSPLKGKIDNLEIEINRVHNYSEAFIWNGSIEEGFTAKYRKVCRNSELHCEEVDAEVTFTRTDNELIYSAYVELEDGTPVTEEKKFKEGKFRVELDKNEYEYTGEQIKPVVTVYSGMTLLELNKDYTVTYSNNIKANRTPYGEVVCQGIDRATKEAVELVPTITIKGKGNYSQSITTTFNIVQKDINKTNISVADAYIAPAPTRALTVISSILDGKKKLTASEFEVTYCNVNGRKPDVTNTVSLKGIAAGTYAAVVKGKLNYCGTYSKLFDVTSLTLMSSAKVVVDKNTHEVTAITVARKTYKGAELEKFDITYPDESLASRPGTHQIKIKAGEELASVLYEDECVVEYKVAQIKLNNKWFVLEKPAVEFDGSAKMVGVLMSEAEGTPELTEGPDRDYTVEYKNNVKAGKASVVITGVNEYTGKVTLTFNITKPSIGNKDVEVIYDTEVPFNKLGAIQSNIVVKYNGKVIPADNYTVAYKNNKVISTETTKASFTIKSKGSVVFDTKDPIERSFEVVPKAISASDINVVIADVLYTNDKAYTQKPIVTEGKTKLVLNRDYVVTYDHDNAYVRAEDLIENGYVTVTATVTGIGSYAISNEDDMSVDVTYRVCADKMADLKIVVEPDTCEYDSKPVTPEVRVYYGVKIGQRTIYYLVLSSEYSVEYSNNNKVGRGTVKVTGTGRYFGSKTAQFKIVAKQMKSDNL